MMNQEVIRIDLNEVNAYLLKSDEGFILADTGGPMILDKGDVDRGALIGKVLDKEGCNSHNLHLMILTHGDIDHVFYASDIKDKFQVICLPIRISLK